MINTPELSRVAAVIRDTADSEIMPYWLFLRPDDVREKAPGDPVTVADEACEKALRAALRDIDPDANILGEEDPDNHARLVAELEAGAPTWVIDPLDGTRPFTMNKPGWGVQVAYCRNAMALAGWLHDPVRGLTAAGDRQMSWLHTRFDANHGSTALLRPDNAGETGTVGILDDYGASPDTHAVRAHAKELGLRFAEPAQAGIWIALEVAAGRIDAGVCTRMRPWDFLPIAGALRAAGAVVRPLTANAFDMSGGGNDVLIARTQKAADTLCPRGQA
mgnify:CR=1 FL=1